MSPSSPLRFNYRRVVGGARVLLTEASPWKLLFQHRIRELKSRLVDAVSGWPGVSAGPHRFGGTEFLVDGREIGHIHEWGLLDVPLVRPLGDAVVEAGVMGRHHILPNSGWVTTVMEDGDDLRIAIKVLRLSYLWHAAAYSPDGVDRGVDDVLEEVRGLGLPEHVEQEFERVVRNRV